MTSLSSRGYGIPIDDVRLSSVRDTLTVKQNIQFNMGNTDVPTFKVYLESSKKVYLPKVYGLTEFGLPDVNKIEDGIAISDDLEFTGSLRENQMEPVQSFLNAAKNPLIRGGILQLPPGWGKTVMAIHIAIVLKQKTLVVVHKDFLLKQWKERIEQYVPMAKIGLYKQNKCITDNCDFVLASLQTICSRDFKDPSFGLVIIDECHHMGAQVFSQAFHKMNFKYSMGLSATVTRVDGLSKVFKWFIGDVVFKAKRDKMNENSLNVLMKEFSDTNKAYSLVPTLYNGKPNFSKMLNNVCYFAPRTDMICDEICKIMEIDTDRFVIVLSDRRKHLEHIFEGLVNRGMNSEDLGYYVGGMKSEHLVTSESKRILLGTYNMVSEGFDLPKLDTLIMASPKSSVEQSIGRIQRKLAKDRKYTPLVLDIVDNISLFQNQKNKRLAFYKKNGYSVSDGIKILNDEPVKSMNKGQPMFLNTEEF